MSAESRGTVSVDKQIAKALAVNPFSPEGMASFLSFLKETVHKLFGGRLRNVNEIKVLNIVLLAVLVMLSVYFISHLTVSARKAKNFDFKLAGPAKEATQKPKVASRLKDLAFYTDKIKNRDIFKMGPRIKGDAPDDVLSSKAAEAARDLRLAGISWSDEPDAMIENKKIPKTYFVQKGQMVGDFKVESILKDKVVLRYGDELVELR
jgi:hypothetical protein